MQIPPLTRSVGLAERSMRALLEQKLARAKLSFSEWTVLAFTSAAPLNSVEVVQRQIAGHVVADAAGAQEAIDSLVRAGFIAKSHGDVLAHSEKGKTVFTHLSSEVEDITRSLYGDLPIPDLEATHRTLTEIAKRANSLLARQN
jgi:DNA-binding MarR family transcriptional regulator